MRSVVGDVPEEVALELRLDDSRPPLSRGRDEGARVETVMLEGPRTKALRTELTRFEDLKDDPWG